jgi:type VI secretion system protein ImpM
MLGIGKPKNIWNWAACGKHPVAKDYFRINLATSLLSAFESWFEKGYQILDKQQKTAGTVYSWRFWGKGIAKGNLICGVGKDSGDSMDRRYPLLVMGDGFLDGWEKDWVLLHRAFEKTWNQMEYISSKRFDDLKGLETDVHAIKNPNHKWMELKTRNENLGKNHSLPHAIKISIDHEEIMEKASHLSQKMEVLIPLDHEARIDPFDAAGQWCALLKDHWSGVPNAIFMGGVPEKHFLAIFNRSLNANDFVRLWSVSSQ